MRPMITVAATLMLSTSALTSVSSPAHAIKCAGNVQINKSTRIITPYCEHEYMAKIARSYGVRTSGRRLRNNINHKQKVCEFIGHDIRLSSVCGGLRREDRGGRYAS